MLIALLCLPALSLIMAMAWWIAREPGQSGWTDVIWSFAVGLVGALACLVPAGGASQHRQICVAIMVAFWSLRLGAYIGVRTAGHGDDPRYAELRKTWGAQFSSRLFVFLQIQAFAAWLLVLCVVMASHRPGPFPRWSDLAGLAVLLIAVAGEGLADAQLRRFRSLPANAGQVCASGLWGLSRHPNYFFEWLGWIAYAIIAIGPNADWSPGWAALSGPVFIYWLLVHVSGIPPLEAHMLRSRGDAFRRVQSRVNAFWPCPRHRNAGEP